MSFVNKFIQICFLLLLMSSCGEEESAFSGKSAEEIKQAQLVEIQTYMDSNSLVADTITDSGLHVIHLEDGNGEFPTVQNTVTVIYHGTLLNGTVFDSSRDRGTDATFPLTNVIQGWQEGIPFLSKGGKSILIIPSAIAYGSNSPSAAIPANSVLVFEVELIDFE